MNEDTHLERIISAIKVEQDATRGSFERATGRNRLACLDLTRALDTAMWCVEVGATGNYLQAFSYLRTGFNRALTMFMDADAEQSGSPDAPATEQSIRWSESTLVRHARIAQAERIVNLHKAGLIRLVAATPSQIAFDVIPGLGLLEERDKLASAWLVDTTLERDRAEYAHLKTEHPRIRQLIHERFAMDGSRLVYSSHPEIDGFYRKLAGLYVRRSVGHECIAPSARFGRLPFSAYVAGLCELMAAAHKHANFAAAAVTLSKGKIRVPTTITKVTSLESVSEHLAGALTWDRHDALEVLQLLATSPSAIRELADTADAPLPIFVPVGAGLYASSVAGTLGVPFQLMLRRLRSVHADDWYRHINDREEKFRSDLCGIFPPDSVHCAGKPAILKHNGRVVTDIDAVVLVKATGTLGLFQLKWQDVFGADLRERRSRMTNLTTPSNKWIADTQQWVDTYGVDHILRSSGFPDETLGTVRQVRLFILGRYHVGFGGQEPDLRAAWSTWPEVCQQIKRRSLAVDPVASLFDDVRDLHTAARAASRSREFRIPMPGFEVLLREGPSTGPEAGKSSLLPPYSL